MIPDNFQIGPDGAYFHEDTYTKMTAKQEAELLFQTFLPYLREATEEDTKQTAKKCAMMAARLLKKQYLQLCTVKGPAKPTHWDLVKKEIENI